MIGRVAKLKLEDFAAAGSARCKRGAIRQSGRICV